MSRGEETPLLQIRIARDEEEGCGWNTRSEYEPLYQPIAASFTAGLAHHSAKKGILKRGLALRRASSFTAGHIPPDGGEMHRAALHWRDAAPPLPLSFREAWDALPPLPESIGRTKSLQAPALFPDTMQHSADDLEEVGVAAARPHKSEDSPDHETRRSYRISAGCGEPRKQQGAAAANWRRTMEEMPSFEEFDRPTRRGSLVPAAPPRNLKPEDDAESGSSSEESEVDALEDEHSARPFHRRRWFRRLLLPCAISLACFLAGMALYLKKPHLALWKFEAWRWLLVIAGTVPLYGFSKLVVYVLVVGFESYPPARGAIYYVIGIRRWLQRTLCVGFFMALFAGLLQQSVYDTNVVDVLEVYWLVVKMLACVLLVCIANVLKTLCAKSMSNHFYKDSYCDKMQDALCKEYYLVALAQQRLEDCPVASKSAVGTAMGVLAEQLRAASHAVLPGLSPSPRTRSAVFQANASGPAVRSRRASSETEGPRSSLISHLSEAQRSLASLQSLLSTDMQRARVHQRTRRGSQIEYDDVVPVLPAKAAHNSSFLARLDRVEKHLRRNKLKLTLTERLGAAQKVDEVDSQAEAKKLAFYLFWNCKAAFESEYVELEDLLIFLPEEQARDALEVFDCDADGHISAEDLREAVPHIYENRKNLSAMLHDTKTIVGKLERLLGVCLHLAFIFFYLIIFNVSLTRTWLTVSSLLLSFVFVFGNSIRGIYESVVYLFIVRPFDVGDAILLGATQDWCTVEEITLLNTIFIKWDGSRITCPNAKLSADLLINVTRSQKKGETFKVMVDIGTPPEVFERVEEVVRAHVKDNPLDFSGECSVNANFGGDPMKYSLVIWWSYCYNATSSRLFQARTKLLFVITQQLHKEGILYTLPPCRDGSPCRPATMMPVGAPPAGS